MSQPIRENYSKTLGQNLVFLMTLMDKKRKEVCQDLDIPYTTYSDWVNGNSYPKLENLQSLADYFLVDVSDLYIDISQNTGLVKRLTAYASKIKDGIKQMPEEFHHRSLKKRIEDNNGNVDIIEFDWGDLLTGGYFE